MDSPVRDDFVADILLKHPDTRDGMTHLLIPRGLPRGYSFYTHFILTERYIIEALFFKTAVINHLKQLFFYQKKMYSGWL